MALMTRITRSLVSASVKSVKSVVNASVFSFCAFWHLEIRNTKRETACAGISLGVSMQRWRTRTRNVIGLARQLWHWSHIAATMHIQPEKC